MRNFVLPIVMGVVALMGMVFILPEVFAQGGGSSTAPVPWEPLVDFVGTIGSLKTGLGTIVAGALGLGLAIWGASFIFRIIKRMAH